MSSAAHRKKVRERGRAWRARLKAKGWIRVDAELTPEVANQARARAKQLNMPRNSVLRAIFMIGLQRATNSDIIAYDRKWREMFGPPTAGRYVKNDQGVFLQDEYGKFAKRIECSGVNGAAAPSS